MKRIIVASICGAMLLQITACDSEQSSLSGEMSLEESLEPDSAAFNIVVGNTAPDTPYLKYLGTTDADTSSGAELYRKTYSGDLTDELIKVEYTSEANLANRLYELISSDKSPDLTDKQENSYCYLMSRNYYEDLTPYMDVAAPQWASCSEYIERYSFKGSRFFYPVKITPAPQFLIYDKKKFELFGLDDPQKLWETGKWTQSAFNEAARAFTGKEGGACFAYGLNVAENFFAATGVSLISKDENGRLVNNLLNEDILRMGDFMCLEIPPEGHLGEPSVFFDNLRHSFSVFMSVDERSLGRLRDESPGFEAAIVPFPRDENADQYYYRAESEGYLVPKGAKNVSGAASFINCARLAAASDEGAAEWRERALEVYHLSEADVDYIEKIRSTRGAGWVLDEIYCFDAGTNAAMREMLDAVYMFDYHDGYGWEMPVSDYSPPIYKAIDDINALIE